MVIDFATHVIPPAYRRGLLEAAGPGFPLEKRLASLPSLTDLDARFRALEPFAPLGYRQVLSVASPPAEDLTSPARTAELYHTLNDELRELVERHPDHFAAALGNLPLNDPAAAARELEHVAALGLPGVQVFTNVAGVPLDHPSVLPVVEEVLRRGLVVFLHPARSARRADYPGEERSRFDLWQTVGWPVETTVAMIRLVFSGLFDRVPDARIVTHHLGAMVPYFAGRFRNGYRQVGVKDPDPADRASFERLRRPPADYLRMFYGDTALSGDANAMRCGLTYFGPDHVLFGSDTPFDWSNGGPKVQEALDAVASLDLDDEGRAAVLERNVRSLLRLGGR